MEHAASAHRRHVGSHEVLTLRQAQHHRRRIFGADDAQWIGGGDDGQGIGAFDARDSGSHRVFQIATGLELIRDEVREDLGIGLR